MILIPEGERFQVCGHPNCGRPASYEDKEFNRYFCEIHKGKLCKLVLYYLYGKPLTLDKSAKETKLCK